MEQDSSTELHLSRIREVKDLAALTDDVRDVVKEEVTLENHHHHQVNQHTKTDSEWRWRQGWFVGSLARVFAR